MTKFFFFKFHTVDEYTHQVIPAIKDHRRVYSQEKFHFSNPVLYNGHLILVFSRSSLVRPKLLSYQNNDIFCVKSAKNMFKKANFTAVAALQEVFMESGCEDRSLELDNSDNYPDYNDLIDGQESESSSSSNSKDDDFDVGLDGSRVEIWGVKRAIQGGVW